MKDIISELHSVINEIKSYLDKPDTKIYDKSRYDNDFRKRDRKKSKYRLKPDKEMRGKPRYKGVKNRKRKQVRL